VQLLASAGHVALYDFMVGEKKWVHKGVEGTLFLIRRHSVPIYRYIVLNKKSQGEHLPIWGPQGVATDDRMAEVLRGVEG